MAHLVFVDLGSFMVIVELPVVNLLLFGVKLDFMVLLNDLKSVR